MFDSESPEFAMPLFEFFRSPKPKGKLDPVQEKPGSCFDESHSRSEDGLLIELGWENGQLLKQSHGSSSSSRASKTQPLNLNNVDNDQDSLKVTKTENPDKLKEFPPSVELGMSRNDYPVPWLSNLPMQSDYSTYISSESLGVNLGLQERGRCSFEATHDPLFNSNFTDSATSYQLCPPMPISTLRSQAIDDDSITMSELPSSNKNNMGSANFGCFSRAFALMRSSVDKADGLGFSGVDGSGDKAAPAADVPNIKFGLSKSRVKPTEIIIGTSTLHSGPDKSAVKEVADGEKKSGSSSVCSGNNVEGGSDEPRNNLKRKFHEAESSEDPSEDVEDESVSVKKKAQNRRAKGKRIRCAEVHNLSERKRRDRINEKMRTLQELIPNCNKVDKASMLDEAIEYLKSLQLYLHIMTAGAGMYMSPMMLPTTMQQMVPPMAHCLNMGIGIGNFARPSMEVPNLQFYGLPGQGFPLAMSRPPFIPQLACQGSEANVRRSCQITDSGHQMKQSKNQSAEVQDINGRGISNSQKKPGTYPNITTRRR